MGVVCRVTEVVWRTIQFVWRITEVKYSRMEVACRIPKEVVYGVNEVA